MITLTFARWTIPILIIIAGFILSYITDSGGLDFIPLIVFIGSIIAAVAFCVGHWVS